MGNILINFQNALATLLFIFTPTWMIKAGLIVLTLLISLSLHNNLIK